MKYIKIFLVFIFSFFFLNLVACGDEEPKQNDSTYELKVDEVLEYSLIDSMLSQSNFNGTYLYVEATSEGLKAISEGVEVINFITSDGKNEFTITITIEGYSQKINVADEFVIGFLETKEIEFTVEGASKDDVVLLTYSSNLEIDGFNITAIDPAGGIVYLQFRGLPETKVEIKVVVTDISLDVLNDDFDVDYFEEFIFELEYPDYITDEVTYTSSNPNIATVDANGKLLPKRTGTVDITVRVGKYSQLKQIVQITISVNPVEVIKRLHIQDVVMQKDVATYWGNVPNKYQDVYGSVSNYLFNQALEIVDVMIPIDTNTYTGRTATPEIIETVEAEQKYRRPGIYLEKLEHIIYHDTGNPNAGSTAMANINWMKGTGNTRARSWHYIVDETKVYQTIPDNEVSWQGDAYIAYANSIGIETCINYGTDLFKVWRTTGKLMASLIYKYNLADDCILQHYETSGKDCPQTLRHANLYQEALDLVAGELLYLRTLQDYTITFTSLNPEFVDNTGKVIKNPTSAITVEYEVRITNNSGYDQTVRLSSTIKPAE